ncbi:hypothetical protein [Streptomyces sp. NPDC058385]|uniref:hypothetical protein n=1 Tax=Streptomyces sp. NPDC058385 TaxID=3346473 RepID=UPI00365E111C
MAAQRPPGQRDGHPARRRPQAIPGTGLLAVPQANILFCRLPQQVTEGLLAEGYAFYHDRWEPGTVRFVTSFSHSAQDIDGLIDAVRRHTL